MGRGSPRNTSGRRDTTRSRAGKRDSDTDPVTGTAARRAVPGDTASRARRSDSSRAHRFALLAAASASSVNLGDSTERASASLRRRSGHERWNGERLGSPGTKHHARTTWRTLYKDIHSHPELSLQEKRTAGLAAERLNAADFEVTEGVGGTGVVGLLKNGDGPTVMLRADMDALPVKEVAGLPYARTVTATDADGNETPVMQACGETCTCLARASALLAARRPGRGRDGGVFSRRRTRGGRPGDDRRRPSHIRKPGVSSASCGRCHGAFIAVRAGPGGKVCRRFFRSAVHGSKPLAARRLRAASPPA